MRSNNLQYLNSVNAALLSYMAYRSECCTDKVPIVEVLFIISAGLKRHSSSWQQIWLLGGTVHYCKKQMLNQTHEWNKDPKLTEMLTTT